MSPHLSEIARLSLGTTPCVPVWKLLASSDQGNHIMQLVCFLSPGDQNAVLSIIHAEMGHCIDFYPFLAMRGRSAIPEVMAPHEQRQTVHPLHFVHTTTIPLNACARATSPVLHFGVKTFCIGMLQKRAPVVELEDLCCSHSGISYDHCKPESQLLKN